MRNKIPDLINSVLNDKSGLVKHEALEALGLMQASETRDFVSKALADPNPDVYQTAAFVIKRLDRLKHSAHEYKPSEII
jgi:HEAT repeat protein